MKKKILFAGLMVFMLIATAGYSQKKPKYFIKITFDQGPLKGTHVFTPEKGNYLSQINLELFEGVSKLNASKLTTESGFQVHYISRPYQGDSKVGEHKAKEYTRGCGSLNFIDLKNNQSYKRIDGDFSGCTNTKISSVGGWKKSVYKSRRNVSGSFSDVLTMKIRMDDGTEKIVKSNIEVEFQVQESRRK
ncbi:hypothetical protein [Pseudotenacibaculum haliotis]|uniref:Uncharacterized protein n=1 Tax=Pseudotenacibaculum haliotis TaxID=1862138 RepID=A0ABW5LNN0_9FLAO